MNITKHDRDGVTLFVLEGRIDSTGAAEMDDALQRASADGENKMILDMSGVQYINSAGLRTLADILTQNRKANGNLFLVAPSTKVERVLKIIGFDKFFSVFGTVDEAVAAF